MERKSLYDISWKVTEPEYREDSALSYSIIAKYERSGFNELEHLFDKIESPSLTFGSAVDALLTGGQEEFDANFITAVFPSCPDSIIKIVKELFSLYKDQYTELNNIPNEIIIDLTISHQYQLNWKPETRAKVIKEKGREYYSILYIAENKTILDSDTYFSVLKSVDALKNSEATKFYFAPNNPFHPEIERFYQLKFKAAIDGINYRCMADLIIVDYENKTIQPVDLKTSSHKEWDFFKSFVQWRYDIQARLYWKIIKDNIDRDDYFKGFTLLDYKFIVVNKETLTPLVWECPFTKCIETLYFGKNNQIEMRSPLVIGKELYNYLSYRPEVPNGIEKEKANDLRTWLNTL